MEAPAGHGNFELLIVTGYLSFSALRPRRLFRARQAADKPVRENRLPPELMRLIDQRQGEVFWMNGLAEPWFDLGRPQWASPLQGVPIIFCRRMAAPDANPDGFGARGSKSFAPWTDPVSADVPRLSQDGVRRLCARDDAPA
jgi:hypothetical protein